MLISGLAFIPGSLVGGKLADHLGRKRIMLLFQALATGVSLLLVFFVAESLPAKEKIVERDSILKSDE